MRRLGDMMPDAVGRTELLRAARAKRALQNWPSVVGPILARKSLPDRYEKGTVWVAVSGSAWAQELRMARDRIVARLNEFAGERLFEDVRFGMRPFSPMEPGGPEDPLYDDKPLRAMSVEEITRRRLAILRDQGD
ncbi:MAG: DUF721 domain-containing protein [Fimbriimonadaceae bacterium]|nr:DUF721 domain-containing protein [Fimbriimonadaceae bacterium]